MIELLSPRRKLKLVLLFGGPGAEHDDSIASYEHVRDVLLRDSVHSIVAAFYISRSNTVHRVPVTNADLKEFDLCQLPATSLGRVARAAHNQKLFLFHVIHGQVGEDGILAGWARVENVPGNFGAVEADVIGTNKWLANSLVAGDVVSGIKVPPSLVLRHARLPPSASKHPWLNEAIIVKPGSLGGSVQVQLFPRWNLDASHMVQAILSSSSTAIVQKYVVGEELSCGVLQGSGSLRVFSPLRVQFEGSFFDYESKLWGKSNVDSVPTSARAFNVVQDASRKLFAEFGCFGCARFDFIMTDRETFFLEVNTNPGLMRHSLFTRMLSDAGLTVSDLVTELEAADTQRRIVSQRI